MLRQLMSYGGAAAKVRAMYGRRLLQQDYNTLMSMRTVAEVASYLKDHPGWKDAFTNMSSLEVNRGNIERELHYAVWAEYIRIFKFMSKEDHPLLMGMIYRAEEREILSFLRHLIAEEPENYVCGLHPFFFKYSKLPYSSFSSVRSFDEFLALLDGTEYYRRLAALPCEIGGCPEYSLVKVVTDTVYYSRLFTAIKKRDRRDIAITLERSLGTEADLLNIISIYRVKRFFPEMKESITEQLLPYRHLLDKKLLTKMMESEGPEEMLRLIDQSPYKKLFASATLTNIDDYLEKYNYEFNLRVMRNANPSFYTPLAYLNLKEIESQNIVRIIESVRYGIPMSEIGVYLPGVKSADSNLRKS